MQLYKFGERLAALRMAKGVSARDMSLSLGMSANYVNKIENRKAYPSMQTFYYICEYLSIAPAEFFEEGSRHPQQLNSLVADLKRLDESELMCVTSVVKQFLRRR